ncbi:MAG: hypothetical protein ABUK13_04740 [Gammaproteobacteria bacterium]
MKYQSYLLLITVFFNLSGCAFLVGNVKEANIDVAQFIMEKDFASAISYLDKLPDSVSGSKQLISKRKSIVKSMYDYEEQVLAKARSFVEQGNWKAAIDIYEEALPRLPESSVVYSKYESFKEQQQRYIYELEIKALVTRASSLVEIVKIRQSISESDPYSSMKKFKLFLLTGEAEDVAEELLEYGLKAINDSQYSIAKRTLPLALRLYQSKEIKLANKRLEKLNASMAETLQNIINNGAELYGQERYEEAIVVWQQVLLLDPENSAVKENLKRTKRVIESLRRLKKGSVSLVK